MRIRSEKFQRFIDGTPEVEAEIIVDSPDELPEKDGISGKILSQGSVAVAIDTSQVFLLNSSGEWVEF